MASRHRELAFFCRRHRVGYLCAFGPRARAAEEILRGQHVDLPPESDLVLAVAFEEFFPEENRLSEEPLKRGLGRIFSPHPVDLVFMEEQRAALQWEAFRGVKLFSMGPAFERDLKRRVLTRLGDWYEWWC